MALDYLTCQELVELVTDYFEDALGVRDRARFEEHIMTCPPCQAHLDQMRRTLDVVGKLREDALSDEAEQQLLAAFRTWKKA
jgi:anti-sigma factor RsiW